MASQQFVAHEYCTFIYYQRFQTSYLKKGTIMMARLHSRIFR
uniref:Uncharacterized protein n=1 Tax=Anguilla anguilla TaxID=7936 RepID=A0A0E9QMQ3_ANGAN